MLFKQKISKRVIGIEKIFFSVYIIGKNVMENTRSSNNDTQTYQFLPPGIDPGGMYNSGRREVQSSWLPNWPQEWNVFPMVVDFHQALPVFPCITGLRRSSTYFSVRRKSWCNNQINNINKFLLKMQYFRDFCFFFSIFISVVYIDSVTNPPRQIITPLDQHAQLFGILVIWSGTGNMYLATYYWYSNTGYESSIHQTMIL